jgi:predicted nucleotidyltransferase
MAAETEKSALELISEVLITNGVEFIVVGGQAELLFGSPHVTYDVDLCYRRTAGNLQRLAQALATLTPRLRGAPDNLPFVMDEQTLKLGCNFTLTTSLGDLDLLGYLEPLGDFEAIEAHATTMDIGGLQIKVIHIDDLIAIKKHIRRPKDQLSLQRLLAIKKLLDSTDSH